MSLVKSPVFTGQMVDGELEFTYYDTVEDFSECIKKLELDGNFNDNIIDSWIEKYHYTNCQTMLVDALKFCVEYNNEDLKDYILAQYQKNRDVDGRFVIVGDYVQYIDSEGQYFLFHIYGLDDKWDEWEEEDGRENGERIAPELMYSDDDDDEWVPNPYLEDYYYLPQIAPRQYPDKDSAAPAA